MNLSLAEVYNTYNVNILFTVAALPSRVALGLPPPGMIMQQQAFQPTSGVAAQNQGLLIDPQARTGARPTAGPQLNKKFGEEDDLEDTPITKNVPNSRDPRKMNQVKP